MLKENLIKFFCFFIFITWFILIPKQISAQDYIKFQNNPIVKFDPNVSWKSKHVANPFVTFDNNIFKMWYAAHDGNSWKIAYATSTDGINWIDYPNPVLTPNYDGFENHVHTPRVIKDSVDHYFLYYTASPDDSTYFEIRFAESNDGINWRKINGKRITFSQPWEHWGLHSPMVVKKGSLYYMFYDSHFEGRWRLGYATSADGVNWDKYENNPIFLDDGNGAGAIYVMLENNILYGWRHGGNNGPRYIYQIKSTDFINWADKKIILTPGDSGSFDDLFVASPSIIKIGNKYYLYYTGYNGQNNQIGLAILTLEEESNPLILLPGLMGSWNREAILHNQEVGVFDWKLLPFVKEYDGIINTLKYSDFQENQDFFIFPYDWRKSIDQSSNDLKTFIEAKIPQDKKVNLIGHSLGGLVARIFTQKNKEKVNKLITVGSPHEGVVQVYKPLSAGEIDRENSLLWLAQKLILVLNKSSLETDRETIRKKFPVAYDLFPTFNFLKNEQNQEKPINELSIKNNLLLQYNQTFPEIFPLFIAFYGEKDNKTPAGYTVTSPNPLHQILGNYEDGQPVNIFYEPGDYTVLSKSANKDTDSEKLIFDHGEIITEKEAIRKILNQLNIFPNEIYPGKKTTITPSLIFLIKSPAKITIKKPNNQLIEETDGIIFLEDAQPGEYQLQIQGINKGRYTLITGQITENNDIWETKEEEIIQEPPSSQTETYSFYFDTNQPQSIFPTPTPQATPSPTPTSLPTPTPTLTLTLTLTPTLTPLSPSPSPTPLSTNHPSPSNNNSSQSSNNNSLTQENNLLSKNINQATFLKPSLENKKEAVLGVKNDKKKEIENKQNRKNNLTGIILVILSLIIATLLIFSKLKRKILRFFPFQK